MYKLLIFVSIFLIETYFVNGDSLKQNKIPLAPSKESYEIGTPCECDISKAWLDIVVVMDRSGIMGYDRVSEMASQLMTIFYSLTIGQNRGKNTRVGIVSFASDARIEASLTKINSFDDLSTSLMNLAHLVQPNDTVVDVEQGLNTAFNLFKKSKLQGPPVILLIASAASILDVRNPLRMADMVKEIGIKIITIDYSDGVVANLLEKIAIPHMNFPITVNLNDLHDAFCNANCICPSFTAQFISHDKNSNKPVYYADCLQGDSTPITQRNAQKMCASQNDGVLVSITSQEKFNFITEKVVPIYVGKSTPYWIGLHKNEHEYTWYGYHNHDFLLANFTRWNQASTDTKSGQCIWANKFDAGSHWNSGDCNKKFGYICQSRACDTTHPCIITDDFTVL